MSWVISILTGMTVLTGVLMTFLILLQEGKGGGLAALGGTKAAGVEGVTNPVRRATAYLAVIFFIMLVTLGYMHKPTPTENLFTSTGATMKKDDTKSTETKPAEALGAPANEAPKAVELPKINGAQPVETLAPKAAPTDAEAPKTDAPKVEEKKVEEPKIEEKKAEEAKK